jgi:ribonuclease HI
MLNRLHNLPKIKKASRNDAKIYPSGEYTLNFDGASKGNPGLAGTGMVIYKGEKEIWSSCKFIGYKTNNQAEYSALIFGLKNALELGIKNLSVLGDSLLVINQVNGIYRVKSETLADLHKQVIDLKSNFDYIEFNHVYRESNKRADELSNLALENVGDLSNTQLEKNNETAFEKLDDIQELDEDWVEEIKIEEETLTHKSNKLKEKHKTRIGEKQKQAAITDFFKLNPLFPNS